jgi:hypothetical protein
MTFDADESTCSFRAQWRFPDGLLPFHLDPKNEHWAPKCYGSAESPFAIACDLGGKVSLTSVAYALRSELQLRASGSETERRVAFVSLWPSDPLTGAPPGPRCTLLPTRTESEHGATLVELKQREFAEFDETECHTE